MCDHLIDALITFLATGLGVLGAFYVDNYRDRKAKQDLKKRLIRGLSTEVNRLEKFLIDNLNLAAYTEYYIETHILEDTVWTATLDLDSCHSKKRIGFPAISVGNFEAA